MKNLLKGITLAFLVLGTGSSYAQRSAKGAETTEPVTTVKKSAVSGYVNANGYFRLAIDNPEGFRYKISVVDESGKIWYEETSYTPKLRRVLDVTYPPAEQLKVLVKGGDEEVSYLVKRTEAIYTVAKQEIL